MVRARSIARSLLPAALLLSAHANAEDAAVEVNLADAALAANCYTCHGPDGRGAGSVPSLVDQPASDLVSKLNQYRAGEGDPTIMSRIAAALTDDQVARIAAYLVASAPSVSKEGQP